MAEQYVYTRANLEQGNVSGFTCRTDGVVGAVQKQIQTLAMVDYHVKNYAGEFVPVWEKLVLEQRQDKVILQKIQQNRIAEGMLQQSSGYVLDVKEEILIRPTAWGGLDYQIQPEQVSLAPRTLALIPLGQVLEFFHMSPAQLLQLVKSCFSSKITGHMTLIGVDYSRREAVAMGNYLLMWMFSLMPLALRRELNCTTCYQGGWNGRYHLGLVPVRTLDRDGQLSAGIPRGVYSGQGTLFYQGKMDTDVDTGRISTGVHNGAFSQWLATVIRRAAAPEGPRSEQLLQWLDTIYRRFDRMIASLPQQDRFKLNYYDALCWNMLQQDNDTKPTRISGSDLIYLEDFLAFGSWPEVLSTLDDMLYGLAVSYKAPADTRLIRLMTKIVLLDGDDSILGRARDLFSAFLACDMESAEMGESSAVSARYLQQMTANGMERSAALQYLGRAFFPDHFPVQTEDDNPDLWAMAGTSRLPIEGLRRCNDWMSGYVNVCLNAEELIDCADTVMRELEGLPYRLLESALDCLLGAQEARCYYAKLEILPAHLLTCSRWIAAAGRLQPGPGQPVTQRYYSRLRKLLCRQYISYWTGRNTLTSICNLVGCIPPQDWYLQENAWLRELLLSQCADISEYDWDRLKEQLNKEDSGILQRLWQILELLEQLQVDGDLINLMVRQVCRYILHRVPPYVNGEWLVCQVRDLDILRAEGYYLELLTLGAFLQGKELSLDRLQECINTWHVPGELMKDMMKFLFRVFCRGGLPRLSPVSVQGFYIACRERLKVDQAEVFSAICRESGGTALLELLNHWPTGTPAEKLSPRQQKALSAVSRKGTYPWLKTNSTLMDALERFLQDRESLSRAATENETFYLELAQTIDALAPVGTQVRPAAVRMTSRLLALQEENASVKIRLKCSTCKRRLLAEQKG